MRSIKIGYIDTVHGECPHCHEDTLLVAIVTDYYKMYNVWPGNKTICKWLYQIFKTR